MLSFVDRNVVMRRMTANGTETCGVICVRTDWQILVSTWRECARHKRN